MKNDHNKFYKGEIYTPIVLISLSMTSAFSLIDEALLIVWPVSLVQILSQALITNSVLSFKTTIFPEKVDMVTIGHWWKFNFIFSLTLPKELEVTYCDRKSNALKFGLATGSLLPCGLIW